MCRHDSKCSKPTGGTTSKPPSEHSKRAFSLCLGCVLAPVGLPASTHTAHGEAHFVDEENIITHRTSIDTAIDPRQGKRTSAQPVVWQSERVRRAHLLAICAIVTSVEHWAAMTRREVTRLNRVAFHVTYDSSCQRCTDGKPRPCAFQRYRGRTLAPPGCPVTPPRKNKMAQAPLRSRKDI